MRNQDKAKTTLTTKSGASYEVFHLGALEARGGTKIERLPYTIKILLENCLRNWDGEVVTDEHIEALAAYDAEAVGGQEIPFKPGRVLLQDLTGVPALVDLAALRSAVARMGGDVSEMNPSLRVDLVIDHSVQIDAYGSAEALSINRRREFDRNQERYQLLKWGEQAFEALSLVPPGVGIVHQVNLEHLAAGVLVEERDGVQVALPDTLVGADSHTTMVNGLGVVGWGVGGIEAEACMLGQPIFMQIPEVVGVELQGKLGEGATATDLVLYVTQTLRAHNVVGKFVEFYGDGLGHLPLADRATIANMAPEYGATMGFFPIDDNTLAYLRLTGREEAQVELVEAYAKMQGLWREPGREIAYASKVTLDLSAVQPALAGPTRPQDRIVLSDMKSEWGAFLAEVGGRSEPKEVEVQLDAKQTTLRDGAVVIAAITSCTNTSNPGVMLAAGLLARNAHALGLRAKPWVKTSLAPGSRVVTDYLARAGLDEALEAVGFFTVGYGCTTCIGNAGPLADEIVEAVKEEGIVVTSVLSGNRNFEGRISPHTRGNYLASPPLVVAYALAGSVDVDFTTEPLGHSSTGEPIFLRDIWPSSAEVREVEAHAVEPKQFQARYAEAHEGTEDWHKLTSGEGAVYGWSTTSTYIQEPPFFANLSPETTPLAPIIGARCLAWVGDSVTTDHISPAGAIPFDSPAAAYLRANGVRPFDFNTYGTRRGNDRVMVRGTFGNVHFHNQLAPGHKGGYTTYHGPAEEPVTVPQGEYTTGQSPQPGDVCWIYDAAVKYKGHGVPLVVLAGKDYGMGSSRDWAAKGPHLLGVRAVIAESYERIHRANLIGMGILPLQFVPGEDCDSLGLTGEETFDIELHDDLSPQQHVTVHATLPDGQRRSFSTRSRVDSPIDIEYLRNGGILHTVLRKAMATHLSGE